jgi:two-component system, NtrC family, nitrogen regulation sensor histidine kinase GlnL
MISDNLVDSATGRRILENLNTAVLLFDGSLNLQYINPAGEVLFAVSTKQITGQSLEDLLPLSVQFTDAIRRAHQSGNPYTEREVQLILVNQQTVTVDCTITPLNDPQDNGLLMELLQLDRHLRIAREETLLAQYQTSKTLIRGIAHEIKNPLGGLRGAAQLLERELPHAKLREYTQVIIGEADRLQNLLDRMLGPNALPHKRLVNIHEIVERVYTLLEAEASEEISIFKDYDPSIPELNADPDQLIQAVLNIARNALQAMNGSGNIILQTRIQRSFTIRQQHHKNVATVHVIDDGPGIAPDMIDSIFYPMITGYAEGTGLGLPIAQSLVNQHGGLIECSSRPGRTVFTIFLPLETNDA